MANELSFDFSEIPDGEGFPSDIGVSILRVDTGVSSIVNEPDPDTYYYAQGGLGVFKYTEEVLGSQVDRRGLLASPGSLEGTDADLSIIFSDPLQYYNESLSGFFFRLGFGYRGEHKALSWVGGMLESMWTPGGGWDPKWKLSIVRVDGETIDRLNTLEEDVPYRSENDLTVRVKGDEIGALFNGVQGIQAENVFHGGSNVVLWVAAYADNGVGWEPIPLVKQINAESLSSGKSFSVKEMPGHFLAPPITEAHFYRVPVRDLMNQGSLVQVTDNSWKFREDVVIERSIENRAFAASKGFMIVAPRMTLKSADYQLCRFKYS